MIVDGPMQRNQNHSSCEWSALWSAEEVLTPNHLVSRLVGLCLNQLLMDDINMYTFSYCCQESFKIWCNFQSKPLVWVALKQRARNTHSLLQSMQPTRNIFTPLRVIRILFLPQHHCWINHKRPWEYWKWLQNKEAPECQTNSPSQCHRKCLKDTNVTGLWIWILCWCVKRLRGLFKTTTKIEISVIYCCFYQYS